MHSIVPSLGDPTWKETISGKESYLSKGNGSEKQMLSKYCSFYIDGPFSKFYPIERKKPSIPFSRAFAFPTAGHKNYKQAPSSDQGA